MILKNIKEQDIFSLKENSIKLKCIMLNTYMIHHK